MKIFHIAEEKEVMGSKLGDSIFFFNKDTVIKLNIKDAMPKCSLTVKVLSNSKTTKTNTVADGKLKECIQSVLV